jgi:hypothetical protein
MWFAQGFYARAHVLLKIAPLISVTSVAKCCL